MRFYCWFIFKGNQTRYLQLNFPYLNAFFKKNNDVSGTGTENCKLMHAPEVWILMSIQ